MGPVDDWPAIGTELVVDRSDMRLGGSAGNAFLAMRMLGAQCRLLSRTGNDMLGAWLAGQVEALGETLASLEAPTSVTTGIVHRCGERSFFTTRGHLEHLCWEELSTSLDDAAEGDIVLLTGAFLLPKLQRAYPILIPELRARGYRVAIDTGWPSEGWTSAVRDEVAGWIAHCDHLLLNETELLELAGKADVEQALSSVAALLPSGAALIVKMGPEGAVGLARGTRCSAAAPDVTPFDTIGAGDSFNAGYLHARLLGLDLGGALQAGCSTASRIISSFPRNAIGPGELAF